MTGPGAGEVGHQGGGYPTDGHRQVVLDGRSLTLAAIEAVARHGVPVRFDPGARRRMEVSRRRVEQAGEEAQAFAGSDGNGHRRVLRRRGG